MSWEYRDCGHTWDDPYREDHDHVCTRDASHMTHAPDYCHRCECGIEKLEPNPRRRRPPEGKPDWRDRKDDYLGESFGM